MGPAPHWHSPLLKQQRCPPPSLQASLVPSFFDSSFSSGVLDRRSTTSGSLPDAPRDLAGSILHSRSRVPLPRWPFPVDLSRELPLWQFPGSGSYWRIRRPRFGVWEEHFYIHCKNALHQPRGDGEVCTGTGVGFLPNLGGRRWILRFWAMSSSVGAASEFGVDSPNPCGAASAPGLVFRTMG